MSHLEVRHFRGKGVDENVSLGSETFSWRRGRRKWSLKWQSFLATSLVGKMETLAREHVRR